LYVNEAYIVTCIVNHVKQMDRQIYKGMGGVWNAADV